jgi:hypothetical protein
MQFLWLLQLRTSVLHHIQSRSTSSFQLFSPAASCSTGLTTHIALQWSDCLELYKLILYGVLSRTILKVHKPKPTGNSCHLRQITDKMFYNSRSQEKETRSNLSGTFGREGMRSMGRLTLTSSCTSSPSFLRSKTRPATLRSLSNHVCHSPGP